MVRKIFTWFFGLLALMMIGMVGAYYLAKKYEAPVRDYIVSQVNKRLQAPVHVSDINFSFLSRFPSASLVMDSVWAEENLVQIGEPDTLFFFEKVYLNLNILDIIDGQYKINEIETRDGFMRLKVDDKGYDNFHIWVEGEDTTGFLLELDKVHTERSMLEYHNAFRRQTYRIYAHDLDFRGRFSNENYTMQVSGEGLVEDIVLKGTNYLHERLIEVETELEVFTEDDRYALRNGQLTIDNDLKFLVEGSIATDQIDLDVEGIDLDIIRSLSLIPAQDRAWLDDYSSSGKLSFDCTLKGVFGRTENPAINAKFSFQNASITKKGARWDLAKLHGNGSITNGEALRFSTTKIQINSLQGLLNGDSLAADFTIENLMQPTIQGEAQLITELDVLKDLVNWERLEEAEGRIILDASLSTTLLNPDSSEVRDFLNSEASGHIGVYDAAFKIKEDDRRYEVDSAEIQIEDNSLRIETYQGRINDVPIALSGMAHGFLNYLFSEKGTLDVEGRIETGTLKLDELFASSSEGPGGVVVAFPERASWDLDVYSERFELGKFVAENVEGRLVMNAFKAEASDLRFNSQQGEVKGKIGLYRFNENQFGLRTDFNTEQVNVTELFETFNQFGQQFITSDDLRGNVDADVQFQAFCDSLLNIDLPSVVATANLRILDGALVDFKPLIDVSDAIRKKPMLRLFVSTDELRKRLQTVQFDTLENEITIKDGVVQIPRMDIRSSAVDLSISGTHSFNQDINYHMDFALSEVLELKDRSEPYNEYVRRDQKGRTRVFVTMIGTTEDFEVEVERTNIRNTLRDDLTNEKNSVKGLLKEEFGVFKGDSSATFETEPEPDLPFEFDPEAGSSSQDTMHSPAPEKKEQPTEKKSKLDRLLKKTESDKKKLEDGDFEDDDF